MTKISKGPFWETGRSTRYVNPWMKVEEASVIRPDGSDGIFGLVHMNPGTTVVAINNELQIFMVREYKYAMDCETLELISGGIDEGETPEQAGLRELQEETGYVADQAFDLGFIDPFTSVINSRNYIILALGLTRSLEDCVHNDIVHFTKMPFSEAFSMALDSKITHGASCVGIMRAHQFLHSRKIITYT